MPTLHIINSVPVHLHLAGGPASHAVAAALQDATWGGRPAPVRPVALTIDDQPTASLAHPTRPFRYEDIKRSNLQPGRYLLEAKEQAWARVDLPSRQVACTVLPRAHHGVTAAQRLVGMALADFLRQAGFFLLHACCASRRGRGVLVAGNSGSGKTTVLLALLTAGWRMVSDDVAVLSGGGPPVTVLPSHCQLRLCHDTLERLQSWDGLAAVCPDDWRGKYRCRLAPARVAARPVAPRTILFTARGHDHQLRPLAGAEALCRLLPLSMYLDQGPEVNPHFDCLARLAGQAAAYELRAGPHLAGLGPFLSHELAKR